MERHATVNTTPPTATIWTAREIGQQPAVWRETRALLDRSATTTDTFLSPLLARPDLRLVLTGAGSSAYLGRCIAPDLLEVLGRRVEAIATTDLVAAPRRYFQRHVPTLLVSFARSGNSPESLAAAELADRHVDECYQLVITCNGEGALYRRAEGRARYLAVVLPEATHDRGFAMTSSFSSMLLAAYRLLAPARIDHAAGERISAAGAAMLIDSLPCVESLTERRFTRTVYLGSCGLAGLAEESALKLLELTDGAVAALANSTLGVRHGPKTFITADTLVVIFLSNDPLTRRYDLDLAREVVADGIAGRVVVLSARETDLDGFETVRVRGMEAGSDAELSFPYLAFAQLYALHMSMALGCTPDSPSASGTVNRVVKGVTIHRDGP